MGRWGRWGWGRGGWRGRLAALLWKHAVEALQRPLWTAAEVLSPCGVVVVLLVLRVSFPTMENDPPTYPPFEVSGTHRDIPGWYNMDNDTVMIRQAKVICQELEAALVNFLRKPTHTKIEDSLDTFFAILTKHLPPKVLKSTFLPARFLYAPNTSENARRVKSLVERMVPRHWLPDRETECGELLHLLEEHFSTKYNFTKNGWAMANSTSMADEYSALMSRPGKDGAMMRMIVLGGIDFHGDDGFSLRLSNTPRSLASFTDSAHHSETMSSVMDVDRTWKTNKAKPAVTASGPRQPWDSRGGDPGYWKEAFLSLQAALTHIIAEERAAASSPSLSGASWTFRLQRMHHSGQWTSDDMRGFFQRFLPALFVLSNLSLLLFTTHGLLVEKEARLKEYIQVMGVRAWEYWTAHLVVALLKLLLTSLLNLALLCLKVLGPSASSSVVLGFLLTYGLSCVSLAFAVAAGLRSAKSGSLAAGLIFLLSFAPYFVLRNRLSSTSTAVIWLTSLIPNTGMAYAANVVGNSVGAAEKLAYATPGGGRVPLGTTLGLMALSAALLFALAAYLEGLHGPDGDRHRPFCYPFLPSFWLGRGEAGPEVEANGGPPGAEESLHNDYFEPDLADAVPSIVIRHLVKEFGGKAALKGLSASVFPRQVTALLGHNGAGKSTTVAVLTGLQRATSGTASVEGWDVRRQLPRVQSVLGLCPQYNALFGALSAVQHLSFFAALKGRRATAAESGYLLRSLGLEEVAHKAARTLSGGQKRKLCLAVALVGQSEVVVLDEPTAGVDPAARQAVWRLVQAEKARRTVLLTTHHMAEADLLADRILILKEGRLLCAGSPLFLKKAFGCGYTLQLLLCRRKSTVGGPSQEPGTGTRAEEVLGLVRRHLAEAELRSSAGLELTLGLPAAASPAFPALFRELEERQRALGVDSFGVSVTTMEDVFLRSGHAQPHVRDDVSQAPDDEEDGDEDQGPPPPGEHSPVLDDHDALLTGFPRLRSQLFGLLVKRLLLLRANLFLFAAQMIVPPLLIGIAVAVNETISGMGTLPSLNLTIQHLTTSTLSANSSVLTVPVNLRNCSGDLSFETVQDRLKALIEPGQLASVVGRTKLEAEMKQGSAVGLELDCGSRQALGRFNNDFYHSPAIALRLLHAAALPGANFSRLANHPMPPVEKADGLNNLLSSASKDFVLVFFSSFGLAAVVAASSHTLIREQNIGAKHLQELAGLHPLTYYAANFVFDGALLGLVACGMLGTLAALGVNVLGEAVGLGRVAVALGLSLWTGLSGTYAAAGLFSTPGTGFVAVALGAFTAAMLPLILVGFLRALGLVRALNQLEAAAIVLSPPYNAASALFYIAQNEQIKKACSSIRQFDQLDNTTKLLCDESIKMCCMDVPDGQGYMSDPFAFRGQGIGRQLIALFVQGLVGWAVLWVLESGLWGGLVEWAKGRRDRLRRHKETSSLTLDDLSVQERRMSVTLGGGEAAVVAEATDVAEMGAEELARCPLVLRDLRKVYGDWVAVEGLSFRLRPGHCLGLLGVNGAGKTSTFKMLTGESRVSGGEAWVGGQSVVKAWRQAGRRLGYCPQRDALLPELTGRQTLRLHARLAGYPPHRQAALVNEVSSLHPAPEGSDGELWVEILREVGVEAVGDMASGAYSGGNRRRLSLGVALVGRPEVVLLDEPSAGVDPAARRGVWEVLLALRRRGTALLLTSHSMDECETLCSRLAVMVAGRLRSLGSSHQLKAWQGAGYLLSIKVGDVEARMAASEGISKLLPKALLLEVQQGHMLWEVPRSPGHTASSLFGLIEGERERLNIADYCLSQASLEQIFLALTGPNNGLPAK